MKSLRDKLAARLRSLRDAAELTQDAASRAAGVPLKTWQDWEQGRRCPLATTLPAVAAALGCEVGELLATTQKRVSSEK